MQWLADTSSLLRRLLALSVKRRFWNGVFEGGMRNHGYGVSCGAFFALCVKGDGMILWIRSLSLFWVVLVRFLLLQLKLITVASSWSTGMCAYQEEQHRPSGLGSIWYWSPRKSRVGIANRNSWPSACWTTKISYSYWVQGWARYLSTPCKDWRYRLADWDNIDARVNGIHRPSWEALTGSVPIS